MGMDSGTHAVTGGGVTVVLAVVRCRYELQKEDAGAPKPLRTVKAELTALQPTA